MLKNIIKNDLLAVKRPTKAELIGTKVYFTRYGYIMFFLTLVGYTIAIVIRIRIYNRMHREENNNHKQNSEESRVLIEAPETTNL